jgi:Flp pilus assembly protein TadG
MRKQLFRNGSGSEPRGIALVTVTLLLLVIVPMMGLAIDGGILYLLKARLTQAVDAAALSGAQSLSRGQDLGSQTQNAIDAATRYFQANFKANYWGCTVSAPTVGVTQNTSHMRYVTVSASAISPLYFLRLLGKQTATIAATAQAQRRDVNVMLVLDRSSSMGAAGALPTGSGNNNGQWPVLNAATSFVNQFAVGRDYVGLVVFGGAYFIASPTPNFQPSIVNDINQIVSSGNTGTSQALWEAYNALAQLNQPAALNVILFFTDGLPNGITGNFVNLRTSPTTCAPLAASMQGWIAQSNDFSDTGCPGPNCVNGLFTPGPLAAVGDRDGALISGSGCQFASNSRNVYQDFTSLPTQDIYGNQTSPANPYKPVNLTGIGLPSQVGAASFNAADQAAQRMRAGTLNTVVPLIDAIGFVDSPGAPEKPDAVFMKRVANTIDSPIYNSTAPTGVYILASDQDELQAAFLQIASQILRLSQ